MEEIKQHLKQRNFPKGKGFNLKMRLKIISMKRNKEKEISNNSQSIKILQGWYSMFFQHLGTTFRKIIENLSFCKWRFGVNCYEAFHYYFLIY